MQDFLDQIKTCSKISQTESFFCYEPKSLGGNIKCGIHLFEPLCEYNVNKRDSVFPKTLEFYVLLHLTKGTAWYWSKNKGRVPLSCNQGIIITPNTLYDFATCKTESVIDRICFAGPMADKLVEDGLLTSGIVELGQTRRLMPIIDSLADTTTEKQVKTAISFISILTDIHFENENSNPENALSKIENLLELIKNNPEKWYDCRFMAEYCNMSEVHLRRIFKKETGMSPKLYIDNVKIKKASELLLKNFSVKNVSDILGYSDQFHFSRRFKDVTGSSPRDFIQQFK